MAAAVLGLAGCASGGGGAVEVAVAEDARFFVVDSSGQSGPLVDLDAALEMATFEVALPASLPDGFELRTVQVTQADPRFDALAPAAQARANPVLLSFDGGARGGFAVFEREAGGNPTRAGDAGVVTVEIEGAIAAQLMEFPAGGDQSAWFLMWRACGIDFDLTAPGPDVIPQDEVLALARSFIEACE